MNYEVLEKKYIAQTYPFRGLTLVKGESSYLYDSQGNKYLDLMSNYGVNIFGHSHPKIIESLKTQLEKLINLHSSFTNDTRSLASEALLKRAKYFDKIYWTNSGTEAIEAALKFAAFFTKKKRFIAAKNSFHGKTLGALSATGKKEYREPFEPLLWEFLHIEFGNQEAIKEVIDEKTAAVILEPIQGEAGVIIPRHGYLKAVEKICREKGVLLILDEIQTGLGRTGSFLASEQKGVKADILCLGKGLAGGIPIGATLLTEKIAGSPQRGIQTSTFGGNPLACAGVLAVLDLIDEKLLSRVKIMGDYFLEQLLKIKSEQILEIRGKGLMLAIELKSNNTPFLRALQERKILAIPAGQNAIRFLPPFIIQKKEVDRAITALKEILGLDRN